jgi:hypothetical protein
MIKSYYNPDDGCWWAYQVDDEGNQVGDAEPAPSKKLAERYIKMFIKDLCIRLESNAKLMAALDKS